MDLSGFRKMQEFNMQGFNAPAAPVMLPQKKKRGGFLRDLASGIAEPFSYLANTTIVNPIKELAADYSGNKIALRNARRESRREIGLGDDGKDIVGALKKWGGNSAQAILAATTPALNSAKGAAAFGGATGAATSLTDRDSSIEDVLTGGLAGAATGGILQKAGNILKKPLSNKFGSRVEEAGNRLLGTQANLTRAEARQLGTRMNPATVLGDINKRTGLSGMDSMRNVSDNITGKDGVFSELTRNAIGNTKGVDVSGLRTAAEDIITNKAPLLTNSERKNVVQQVSNSLLKSYGGAKGSLNPLADPFEAFDAAKSFESMASQLRRGASVSAKDKQLADVYQSLAGQINDGLFSSKGVQEGLQQAKPQAIKALKSLAKTAPKKEAQAYTKLAKELEAVTDVKSLRSAQSSFVNLNKIDEATANARAGAASQMGDQLQGAGRLIQKPTNLLALPLNAATPAFGGAMANAGRVLQGAIKPQMPQGPLAGLLGAQGVRGASSAAASSTLPQEDTGLGQGQDMQQDPFAQEPMYGDMSQAGGILGGGMQQPQSMYSRENAAMDIQRDLQATGGKNMDKYLQLYEFMNPAPEKEKPMAASQQQRATAAQNALMDIPLIEGAISSGKLGGAKNLPGAGTSLGRRLLGTEDLDAALFNVADNILRARSGAATPEAEVRRFMQSFLPNPSDSAQAKLSKLQRAQRELQGYMNPISSYDDAGAGILGQQYGY